ncbi:unnamed protein product [Clonostachys rhizophaga]|uniref:Uncharacterized protein n=1 Tax=Clonostachys rhizophaga TaxID=160324 RepID=A0A9N9YX99_9HYPO|nr:unnamed protein product [Clonostachys rhizophaga]
MASVDPAFAGIVCASNFKYIDLIDLIGPLAPILTQRVINIYVVFTQSRDIKPHAELTLEIESAVPLGCLPPGWLPIETKTIVLGMNSHLLTTYDNFGSSITLSTPYLHGAHLCSLRFDVAKKSRSVKEYLQILRRDRGQDLGTFVNGRNYEIGSGVRAKTMGSRDFVTQCMIRWARNSMINLKKVVEYEVAGQLMAPKPPFHFFDLITKPHRIEDGIIRWDGPQIPMEMGIYEGRVTKDFEKYYAPTNTYIR